MWVSIKGGSRKCMRHDARRHGSAAWRISSRKATITTHRRRFPVVPTPDNTERGTSAFALRLSVVGCP